MIALETEDHGEVRTETSVSKSVVRAIGTSRILAELGHGGMANVYLAVAQGQGRINKLLVLKALRPELASEPEALSMFLDEARVAVQLNHPNVVQTYEVGNHGGRQVIVMEYLEGQSLARLMRQCETVGKPLSLAMALRIIIGVLEGLAYTHDLKSYDGTPLDLVHRDISPQNVFVTYEGQVKLLDFGIAKAASSHTDTATGVVKGKFGYMAPEQMLGDDVDRRADIYSVGCMLWAFAAGQKLWSATGDGKILRKVVSGEIPSPRTVNPDCDEELAHIVEKAMAHRREDRYQNALDLQADLEQYLDRLGKPVKQKELAKLVGEIFGEQRAQVRGLVEQQLALVTSEEEAAVAPVRIIEEASASNAQQPFGLSVPDAPKVTQRRWLPVAAALVIVLAGGAWVAHSINKIPPPPAPVVATQPNSRAQAALPIAPAAPVIRNATISFRVTPSVAKLTMDGIALAPGSKSHVLPADGKRHTLSIEAEGYDTARHEFAVSGDIILEVALTKTAAKGARYRPAPRVVTKATASASSAAPAPVVSTPVEAKPAAAQERNCSDPFFLDARGIKRVRPECR